METDSYSTSLTLYFTLGQAFSHRKDFYMMNPNLFPTTLVARGTHGDIINGIITLLLW